MTMPSPPDRGPSRAEFIGIIAGLMALNALAVDVMLPALPQMGEALSVPSENDRQFVLSSYMLGFGVSQLFFGPISDRFGRRAPLMVGLAIYVLAGIAAIFSPNFTTLLLLRALQGVGAAATRVVAQSSVRDRFSGRAMAEVTSLVFMLFMAIPIIAPGVGQLLLFVGPWETTFIFMSGLALAIGIWAFVRLPETLVPERRRPLSFGSVVEGFRIVFTTRPAIAYSVANTLAFGALFGFINTSQQIFVDLYGLGPLFPVAFAGMAAMMAISSFLNSRIVGRFGMRRLAHGGMMVYSVVAGGLVLASAIGPVSFPVFFVGLCVVMALHGIASSNMNALAMEPLGAVAGTAAATFGFLQTVGGALLGGFIGHQFDGTIMPVALGYFGAGLAAILCALIAERGRLFGSGHHA